MAIWLHRGRWAGAGQWESALHEWVASIVIVGDYLGVFLFATTRWCQRLNILNLSYWSVNLSFIPVLTYSSLLTLCGSHRELRDVLPVYLHWQCNRPEHSHHTRALQPRHGLLQQQHQWGLLLFIIPLLLHTSFLYSISLNISERWGPPASRHGVHHSSECLMLYYCGHTSPCVLCGFSLVWRRQFHMIISTGTFFTVNHTIYFIWVVKLVLLLDRQK